MTRRNPPMPARWMRRRAVRPAGIPYPDLRRALRDLERPTSTENQETPK